MKKVLATLLLSALLVPASASAADFSGVYITPKIIGGIQQGTGNLYKNNVALGNMSKNLGSRGVFGGGLALGYDFSKKFDAPVRVELEYTAFTSAGRSYTKTPTAAATPKHVRMNSEVQSLFFNAYFDINTGTNFTPYVGAGLGVGFNRYSSSFFDDLAGAPRYNLGSRSRANFAWNIGAGVAYKFTDNIAVDLGYRYAQFGKGYTRTVNVAGDTYKGKIGTVSMHQFVLGLRVSF